MKNISHTECRCSGFLECVTYCDHCYQPQSLLHCWCAQNVCVSARCWTSWNFCHKLNTCMASLLNELVYVLLDNSYSDNICHILCTWIYLYECSYVDRDPTEMKSIYHTEYRLTGFLECGTYCDHCYQLQSWAKIISHIRTFTWKAHHTSAATSWLLMNQIHS